jgi:hypothetical protein
VRRVRSPLVRAALISALVGHWIANAIADQGEYAAVGLRYEGNDAPGRRRTTDEAHVPFAHQADENLHAHSTCGGGTPLRPQRIGLSSSQACSNQDQP